MAEQPTQLVIGLNFGSGYSCITILNKDQQPEIIANEDGEHKIATVISFLGDEELYGNQAKAQLVRNARNTVADFQPLVGLSYSSEWAGRYPNNTVVEKNGKVGFQVKYQGENVVFTAEELAEQFLKRLVETAANYVGKPVDGVIMAYPSNYSMVQRQALEAVTRVAGLKVLQLVEEAPSAVLAYGIGQTSTTSNPQDTNVLVVDVGANSTTVSAVTVRGGLYSVVSAIHNDKIHGSAFDKVLQSHFQNEFKRQTKIDITGNARAQAKLAASCEITKRTLSRSNAAPCSVESLADGEDLHATINRMRFDILCNKLYSELLATVRKALEAAHFLPSELDQVVLVGGCTRIPRLQAKLRQVLGDQVQLCLDIEPDEVVAHGCAAQARVWVNAGMAALTSATPLVTPMVTVPLGIQLGDESFTTVIPRNTPLPAVRLVELTTPFTYAFVTVAEGKVETVPKQSQGDDDDDEDDEVPAIKVHTNRVLGHVLLNDIPADSSVSVSFQLSLDKILTVVVTEPQSQKSATLTIA
ncbi:Hsp70 protein that interacts with Zuo1p [Dispira simplex]|nr:Hsp70 protein that interacts with Zuo1p [Dispira simplex]